MRDVLGTIQADQDAIIRAGSRGALVVDGGPGTGKTVVALHRAAYLLYADPRLGHAPRRGAVRRPAPALPGLRRRRAAQPRRGGRADLHAARPRAGGRRRAAAETDPDVARLKSSARLVEAIEPAVRFYEEPPSGRLTRRDRRGPSVRLTADDWAEAFDAADPGTPHNEAREADLGRDAGRSCIVDAGHDDVAGPTGCGRVAAAERASCATRCNRAWPLLEADGPGRRSVDRPRLPADVRPLAEPRRGRARCSATDPQAWTVLGPTAARRGAAAPRRSGGAPTQRGGADAAVARRARGAMAEVIDAADRRRRRRERPGMTMLRGDGPAGRAGRRRRRCPHATRTCWPARSRTSSSTRRRS